MSGSSGTATSILLRLLPADRPRIEPIAKPVPSQVETENGESDRRSRKQGYMREPEQDARSLVQERPPRNRLPRTQTEERQRRLGEDDDTEPGRRLNHQWPCEIGNDMPRPNLIKAHK